MVVWRVQNESGRGPYMAASKSWMEDDHCDLNHPCPVDDGIKGFQVDADYCGFENFDALLSWFSPTELQNLKEQNFHVTELEVPDELVQKGRKQLVFRQHPSKGVVRTHYATFSLEKPLVQPALCRIPY